MEAAVHVMVESGKRPETKELEMQRKELKGS